MSEQPAAPGRLDRDEPAPGVVRLSFANPSKRGALDHAILDALAATLPELDARCVILTGEGPIFSAGYDIGGIQDDVFASQAEKLVAHPFAAAIEALEAYPHPVVAALGGHAIGGGLEVALACDLRIASSRAKLGMPPAKLGLIYSHTGLAKFIDAIGAPRTRELFLLGRNVDAATAHAWGLVNFLAEPDDVADAAVALASELVGNAPLAAAGNKRVIRELLAAGGRLDAETERELVELRRACFVSEDFREGVRAFDEKRPPEWRGR